MMMNKIQRSLIAYFREAIENKDLKTKLNRWSDETLARRIFVNFRESDTQSGGLRLTNFGLTFMRSLFAGYEIKMPEDECLSASHLLYLERNTTLPYYCDVQGFVIYDTVLGMRLALADGRLSLLLESDKPQ